eukprot:2701576-Amphidinium_carterae.1
MASDNGYFSSFVPAGGTAGRPSRGLAILCKQAVPQQRMEDGAHWEAGRWGLPFREILVEVMGSVASLGKRPILLGGDWNFEPDDFPIGLVRGALVQRPGCSP